MSAAFENVLYSGRDVTLKEYRCPGTARPPESVADLELVFVRRGCFILECQKQEVAVTPNEAFVLISGRKYSVQHPVDGGDECTVISVASPEIRAALSHIEHATPIASPPDAFTAHLQLFADALEIEERIWTVVNRVFGERIRDCDAAVARARALIAAHFTEPLPLGTIADVAGLSAYHLCRLFRRSTGTSMHQYQTSLRLRAAMVRLTGGESDIARLAADLGFSNHSHLTTSFRREFGLTPSAWRERRRETQCS